MSVADYEGFHWHGPACVCCDGECSGMGRCDDCNGAMCFGCCNFEHGALKPGYRLCDACVNKRTEVQNGNA